MPFLHVPDVRVRVLLPVFYILLHVLGLLLSGQEIRHSLLTGHFTIPRILFVFFFPKLFILN